MKIKKIILLLISIIVPLTITILIGLYAYGTIGDWTGNQEKYVNEIFYTEQTNEKSIENYLKFNSEKYKNHTNNITLYEDYKAADLKEITTTNGKFSIDGLSFSLYNMLSQDEMFEAYHYDFFYYDIDNTIVNPANIVIIFVEEDDDNSVENLKLAIDQFSDEFISENEPSVYSSNSSKLTANILFTTGVGLTDVNGKGKLNSKGEIQTPYLYSSSFLQHQFILTDEAGDEVSANKKFVELESCSFAMLEVVYDSKNDAETTKVLTTGKIENIEPTAEKYISANPDMLNGYGLDADKALTKSGYFGFIWPTILWQTGIAAVITGIFGFLFFKTWTYDDPKQKTNIKEKR